MWEPEQAGDQRIFETSCWTGAGASCKARLGVELLAEFPARLTSACNSWGCSLVMFLWSRLFLAHLEWPSARRECLVGWEIGAHR